VLDHGLPHGTADAQEWLHGALQFVNRDSHMDNSAEKV
jgi:hypothetical protein